MGALYLGTSKVRNVYLGGTKVRQIYLGTNKIFNAGVSFWIGDTHYEFESGSQMYTITSNTTIRFDDFDNSDYKLTVCLIGGGGGASASRFHINWSHTSGAKAWFAAASGGEGGQVISQEIVPAIGSNYSVSIGSGGSGGTLVGESSEAQYFKSINETNGGQGGSTSAFGYTASGGGGGILGTLDGQEAYATGGSGHGGASGGNGGFGNKSFPACTKNGTNGANGTLFNGVYYAGGGMGGGGCRTYEGRTDQIVWYEPYSLHRYSTPGAAGLGQENRGGGGNGNNGYAVCDAGEYFTPQEVHVDNPSNSGNNGAVLLLLQKR